MDAILNEMGYLNASGEFSAGTTQSDKANAMVVEMVMILNV